MQAFLKSPPKPHKKSVATNGETVAFRLPQGLQFEVLGNWPTVNSTGILDGMDRVTCVDDLEEKNARGNSYIGRHRKNSSSSK